MFQGRVASWSLFLNIFLFYYNKQKTYQLVLLYQGKCDREL